MMQGFFIFCRHVCLSTHVDHMLAIPNCSFIKYPLSGSVPWKSMRSLQIQYLLRLSQSDTAEKWSSHSKEQTMSKYMLYKTMHIWMGSFSVEVYISYQRLFTPHLHPVEMWVTVLWNENNDNKKVKHSRSCVSTASWHVFVVWGTLRSRTNGSLQSPFPTGTIAVNTWACLAKEHFIS